MARSKTAFANEACSLEFKSLRPRRSRRHLRDPRPPPATGREKEPTINLARGELSVAARGRASNRCRVNGILGISFCQELDDLLFHLIPASLFPLVCLGFRRVASTPRVPPDGIHTLSGSSSASCCSARSSVARYFSAGRGIAVRGFREEHALWNSLTSCYRQLRDFLAGVL